MKDPRVKPLLYGQIQSGQYFYILLVMDGEEVRVPFHKYNDWWCSLWWDAYPRVEDQKKVLEALNQHLVKEGICEQVRNPDNKGKSIPLDPLFVSCTTTLEIPLNGNFNVVFPDDLKVCLVDDIAVNASINRKNKLVSEFLGLERRFQEFIGDENLPDSDRDDLRDRFVALCESFKV